MWSIALSEQGAKNSHCFLALHAQYRDERCLGNSRICRSSENVLLGDEKVRHVDMCMGVGRTKPLLRMHARGN